MGDLTGICKSAELVYVLHGLKRLVSIFYIAGPILLMISLAILFTKLVINPDEKKNVKRIYNSIIAAFVMFCIPVFVNIFVGISSNNFSISKCYAGIDEYYNILAAETYEYYDIYEEQKKTFPVIDSSKYQQGTKKESSTSSNDDGSTSGSLSTETSNRTINARNAAVNWAINIANDNSFHYGQQKWAHHGGCYYCDHGRQKAKIKDGATVSESAKTYVCTTFVTAAYHHGAGSKVIKCHGGLIRTLDGGGIKQKLRSELTRVSKPAKFTDCEPGDIFLTQGHASMYIGNGKLVEAANGFGKYDKGVEGSSGWNKSIAVKKMTKSGYRKIEQVWRYTGTGKY